MSEVRYEYEPQERKPMAHTHKLKCLSCGLHFVVCSDHENWPHHEGGLGKGVCCPECHKTGAFLHWREGLYAPIFTVVPGQSEFVDYQHGKGD